MAKKISQKAQLELTKNLMMIVNTEEEYKQLQVDLSAAANRTRSSSFSLLLMKGGYA